MPKTTLHNLESEILKARQLVGKLEAEREQVEKKTLLGLPQSLGYSSVDTLIKALGKYASPVMKGRLQIKAVKEQTVVGSAEEPTPKTEKKAGSQRKRRRNLTPERKAALIADLEKGGKTAKQFAADHGVSVATIALYKSNLKLTKAKKDKAAKKGQKVKNAPKKKAKAEKPEAPKAEEPAKS